MAKLIDNEKTRKIPREILSKYHIPESVIRKCESGFIQGIRDLPYIGAGVDGCVFKYGDLALKILKDDTQSLSLKGRMTFEKALYLQSEVNVKRFIKPKDVLLDENGAYCGYAMDYIVDRSNPRLKGSPLYKAPGLYTCGELIESCKELSEDVDALNAAKVLIKDINSGSYIYGSDFVHMCDMDKFALIKNTLSAPNDKNMQELNHIIVKILDFIMRNDHKLESSEKKQLLAWVKKCCNARDYLKSLDREIGSEYDMPIRVYADTKLKQILK